MRHKKLTAILLCLTILLAFTACKETEINLLGIRQEVAKKNPKEVTLDVYAPEEALAPVLTAVENYKSVDPNVTIRLTLDDGVMIAEKVLSGYSCDVLIDFSLIMDQIDASKGQDLNPSGYDCIYSDTRRDIFEGPADEDLLEEGSEAVTLVYSAALTRACKYSDQAKGFIEFLVSDSAQNIYSQCECTGIQ